MPWSIHYNTGEVFTDQDGSPEEAPLDGVQLIVEDKNGQPQYHWGCDFYIWTGDCWQAGYQADFERWVRAITRKIKYGLVISDSEFLKYLRMAE